MKCVHGVWLPEDEQHFVEMMGSTGNYQKDIFQAAMELVTTPKVFYDVGAHVGLWSLMAIKNGFKEIYAFEPNLETFECLKKNLDGQPYDYRAFLNNYGVAEVKNIFMKVVKEHEGNSGAVKLEGSKTDYNAAVTPINNCHLHNDIHRLNIKPHECLVKIDTEGMEASCVLGMDKILYALRPVVVVEQRTNQDALDILQKMGMVVKHQIRKDWILAWS